MGSDGRLSTSVRCAAMPAACGTEENTRIARQHLPGYPLELDSSILEDLG
jgi:hypothetical protein